MAYNSLSLDRQFKAYPIQKKRSPQPYTHRPNISEYRERDSHTNLKLKLRKRLHDLTTKNIPFSSSVPRQRAPSSIESRPRGHPHTHMNIITVYQKPTSSFLNTNYRSSDKISYRDIIEPESYYPKSFADDIIDKNDRIQNQKILNKMLKRNQNLNNFKKSKSSSNLVTQIIYVDDKTGEILKDNELYLPQTLRKSSRNKNIFIGDQSMKYRTKYNSIKSDGTQLDNIQNENIKSLNGISISNKKYYYRNLGRNTSSSFASQVFRDKKKKIIEYQKFNTNSKHLSNRSSKDLMNKNAIENKIDLKYCQEKQLSKSLQNFFVVKKNQGKQNPSNTKSDTKHTNELRKQKLVDIKQKKNINIEKLFENKIKSIKNPIHHRRTNKITRKKYGNNNRLNSISEIVDHRNIFDTLISGDKRISVNSTRIKPLKSNSIVVGEKIGQNLKQVDIRPRHRNEQSEGHNQIGELKDHSLNLFKRIGKKMISKKVTTSKTNYRQYSSNIITKLRYNLFVLFLDLEKL